VNTKAHDGAVVIVVKQLTTETGRPPTGHDARIVFIILHESIKTLGVTQPSGVE
jgi:hypothetical protein